MFIKVLIEMSSFKYIKLSGKGVSPSKLGGREPRYEEVFADVKIESTEYVPVKFFDGVSWISRNTYEYAKNILSSSGSGYEAHVGVTFTAAEGAWLIIGEPEPVEPPIGAPKNKRYVRIETVLSREKGLEPFVIEEDYVFKGFKGEDVSIGKISKYRYFIAAYKRDGSPLSEDEIKNTLLWRNYLGNDKVIDVLKKVSEYSKKRIWHLERMSEEALKRYKVVWRDVAKEFIPAIEMSGAVPDYTVNYVVANSLEEAQYLLAILLAPQINEVIKELSPWIGHIQPRFIKYFKIPKYNPKNEVHKRLKELGEKIYEEGEKIIKDIKEEIETLVEKL